MPGNIAKNFARQTLLYWEPVVSGSGMKYDAPVEFKGAYIGNSQLGDGGPSDVVYGGGSQRDNLVLFYLQKPLVDGYVCWTKRLSDLTADGTVSLPPDQIEDTHKIRTVIEYVMPGVTTVSLSNQAFIASAM
jgi:hypothetical protein